MNIFKEEEVKIILTNPPIIILIIYYLSIPVCPPGFSDPLLWARRVYGPAAAFNVYKSPPTLLLDYLLP